ncbi:MAG: DNA polymerase/3'-5' exonuclease PolX [Euryarchaeota archaeon]|nr:DNA polymerase/3'-5' exonuclease PolX [Euryarchaeota archaeon]
MKNESVAKILYEIADILEAQDVQWKPAAYRKAAMAIESLSEEVEDIYRGGGKKALLKIPGIGENISKKVEEMITTGGLGYYARLKKELPIDFGTLTAIPGLGPKKLKKLFNALGVRTLEELKEAAERGKIAGLEGFGEKSEQEILKGIALLEKTRGRALLGAILPDALAIVEKLKESKAVGRIGIAGSLRRMKETVGDIDILATSGEPGRVMGLFVSLPEVEAVFAKGMTKSSVHLKNGLDCDLRVVEEDSFGSALQYFTGSKDHNIALRKIAIKMGYKLSEYGIFKGEEKIAGRTEEEVYGRLGLPYIEPELRENTGEIEAAQEGRLPALIELEEVRGDLHVHTNWSDGSEPVEEVVLAARERGYEWVCISDHSQSLRIAHGLDERDLERQFDEIERVKGGITGIEVLRGIECDIRKDGSLDLMDETLERCDIVIGAVHSHFNLPMREMTERMMRAMENPNLDIIGHPTGRLLGEREAYELDWERLFDAAEDNGIAFEINAFPSRLDLDGAHIKAALAHGLQFAIGTDAHTKDQMDFMELGVATARRGWAEGKDVLNTLGAEDVRRRFSP